MPNSSDFKSIVHFTSFKFDPNYRRCLLTNEVTMDVTVFYQEVSFFPNLVNYFYYLLTRATHMRA
ncbi:hypothetical protein Hanom_Chr01g00091901 [Helianthus anomalus]